MTQALRLTLSRSILLVIVATGCAPAHSNLRSTNSPALVQTNEPVSVDKQIQYEPLKHPNAAAAAPVTEAALPAANSAANPSSQTDLSDDELSREIHGGSESFKSTTTGPDGKIRQKSATTPSCLKQAISILQSHSPSGYRTYQRLNDKSVFAAFVGDCSDTELFYEIDLSTAVHESNHMLRAESEQFHLISDEMLPVPAIHQYFSPGEMAKALAAQLKAKDAFFKTYLAADAHASSKDNFTYLLDELNAYTNDLQVAVDMTKIVPLTQRQAGVPALMTFVSYYVAYAQAKHPDVWNDLQTNPAMNSALGKLWTQAENVLVQACHLGPESPSPDLYYIRYLCDTKQTGALATVLGRQSVCPSECH